MFFPGKALAACPNGGAAGACPCTVTSNSVTCDLDTGASTQGGTLYAYSPTDTSVVIWGDDGEGVAYCCEGGSFNDVAESGSTCSESMVVDGVPGYADLISFNNEAQTLYVTKMVRQARGLSGNDEIYGSQDTECIDQLYGGDDADTIHGLAGNDYIEGNAGNDTCYGGVGDDNILGGENDDVLWGNDGNDDIYGGTGDDQIKGGDGNDYAQGDSGDDDVCGQGGADELHGNAGADMVVIGPGGLSMISDCSTEYDYSDFASADCDSPTLSSCPW